MKKELKTQKTYSATIDGQIDLVTTVIMGTLYVTSFMSANTLGYIFCSLVVIHAFLLFFLYKVKGKEKFLMLSILMATGFFGYATLGSTRLSTSLMELVVANQFTWLFMVASPFFIKSLVMLAFNQKKNKLENTEES